MEDNSFVCSECGCRYQYKKSLGRHIRQKHTSTAKKKERKYKERIKCYHDNCDWNLPTFEQYFSHLQAKHNEYIKRETYLFGNENAFLEWKENTEERLTAMYVKDSATKVRKNNHRTTYYLCHRSLNPATHKGVKRKKYAGSNKISAACPSLMVSTATEKGITVEFYPIHGGHNCEVGRLSLTKKQKAFIAGKLAMGLPVSRILDDVRNNIADVDEQIVRMHLLNRQDINNIRRDFNIKCPIPRHENDATSVEILIDNLRALGNDNPIILYKNQSTPMVGLDISDLVIIIMTNFQKKMLLKFSSKGVAINGTHRTNPFDFQLFTLLITDEKDNGEPVAYMVSNGMHEELFVIFFREIRKAIGKKIQTDIFVSDDAESFYNAWLKVNPPPKKRLVCWWHVNKNWVTNANLTIKDSEKRALVLKTLQSIKDEVDEEKCLNKMRTFLDQLKDDGDTKNFFTYFSDNYLNKIESWALCYRKHTRIHTNIHLESLNKILDYEYLNERQCNKAIDALLRFTRDKKFDRLIKLNRYESTKKTRLILKSHEESKEYVTLVQPSEMNKWTVGEYIIEHVKTTPPCCMQICQECNICIHNYTCSCLQNVVKFVICKHIHACATVNKINIPADEIIVESILSIKYEPEIDELVETISIDENEPELGEPLVEQDPSFFNNDNNLMSEIFNHSKNEDLIAKSHIVLDLISTRHIDEESTRQANKYLDEIIRIFQGESAFTPLRRKSGLENLDVQTFCTRKKKKASSKGVETSYFPSSSTGNIIREAMETDEDEILDIVDTSVHTYASQKK